MARVANLPPALHVPIVVSIKLIIVDVHGLSSRPVAGRTVWNKKHLKNVGPIRYCEPPHAHSPDVASGTVARRLSIDVHNNNDDNDNA